MTKYAALDVSMEQTAICVVDENGRKVAEGNTNEPFHHAAAAA